ncbi:hypothetical protein D3C78_1779610 [compost metagenome]
MLGGIPQDRLPGRHGTGEHNLVHRTVADQVRPDLTASAADQVDRAARQARFADGAGQYTQAQR